MTPINGLTQVRRLPRLGKVRMGIKIPAHDNVKEHPQKTDYFVVTPEVAAVYGDKPKSLDILIPVEDEEKWAPQYYKLYSTTQGLVCRGDGIVATRLVDTDTGDRVHRYSEHAVRKEMTCQGRQCGDYLAKDCKEVMSLQFILYKVPGMGIWQIDTSSINSIININSCADYIRAMFGRLAMIPLQLTIEPKQVQNPESGKRQTVYVLNLRNNLRLLDMIESTKKFQQLLPSGQRLALPPADDAAVEVGELAADGEEPETAGAVAGEIFHPEAIETRTESDIEFDSLESASNKLDVDWAISTILTLQKKGVAAVQKEALSKTIHERFLPSGATPEKMTIKALVPLLSHEKAEEFATWLQELEGKS